MLAFLKMKTLMIGLLLASPPVAAWMLRAAEPAIQEPVIRQTPATSPAAPNEAAVQVPVEVVAEGSAPEWVYVEVQSQTIPEPGSAALAALASLLLLRRQRPAGK